MDSKAFLQSFIASVSHEFKTPLASLTASLEIYWDESEHLSRQEIHELMKSLRLSVTNLQMLVDNLLDSATIQAEQLVIKPQPIALPKLITAAAYIIQPILERRDQSLTYFAPLRLPLVHADSARLHQVLLNLLVNASKYSPQGSVIDIQAENDNAGFVRVSIADQGNGVPLEQHEHIFRPFIRFDNGHADEQGGLGMGLAVVKAIIDAHGGQVGTALRVGEGAVFWFTLRAMQHENPRR